ncbi:MAG: hypothetical protein JWP71_787 [Mucilaginibacter sp.]|nr:hypothetical protein [Mucilaginibacter sp.]
MINNESVNNKEREPFKPSLFVLKLSSKQPFFAAYK